MAKISNKKVLISIGIIKGSLNSLQLEIELLIT